MAMAWPILALPSLTSDGTRPARAAGCGWLRPAGAHQDGIETSRRRRRFIRLSADVSKRPGAPSAQSGYGPLGVAVPPWRRVPVRSNFPAAHGSARPAK